ncbi:MAG: formyl transferase [Armatimonadota bacterium]
MRKNKTIVMLAGESESTNIVYNAISQDFPIDTVLIEEPTDRSLMLKKRTRKLGIATVAGQVLFRLMVVPLLAQASEKRLREIMAEHGLDDLPIDDLKLTRISSVNADETMLALQKLDPAVVIVNRTRIIGKHILTCVPAPFINTHAGITPRYRGVHGAYWALVEDRRDLCGVTVHLVDAGIDTGNIIAQALIEPTQRDNFVTYPLLQVAAGLSLLKTALHNALEGSMPIHKPLDDASVLWSHPTAWGYLWTTIRRGIK